MTNDTMPNDQDLRALLEALEAEGAFKIAPYNSAEEREQFLRMRAAMPVVRKLLRGEIALPLECERPVVGEPYVDAAGDVDCDQSPCGACDTCQIIVLVRKP